MVTDIPAGDGKFVYPFLQFRVPEIAGSIHTCIVYFAQGMGVICNIMFMCFFDRLYVISPKWPGQKLTCHRELHLQPPLYPYIERKRRYILLTVHKVVQFVFTVCNAPHVYSVVHQLNFWLKVRQPQS